ncbi:hypothetical protein GOEFS_108_00080 [Gordonia effusa NBRC 100432]|uniref:Uncharacterized protein n=1 Tax=Gordonia effusa NBRC 100432 TaxID=1077974 RepID=H0R597_9ACTN|nr:hypothetical protein [Gordonia effusa]GAB20248.1 hypothetical protein GOEFS_108_00080 [Gordonia effusa NBRC 100432]
MTADRHAVIVTSEKVLSPSGRVYIAKPVSSIADLVKILDWTTDRIDLRAAGLPPQLWLIGGACEALGWGPDDVDPGEEGEDVGETIARLDQQTHALLGPHLAADANDEGWHLYVPKSGEIGWRLHLSRLKGGKKYMVDVHLEMWAMVTARSSHDRLGILGSESAGTLIDFDDDHSTAAELARRLIFHVDHLGVLPGNTPARTGQVVADQIYRERQRKHKAATTPEARRRAGIVVDAPLPIPPTVSVAGDLEPHIGWVREWLLYPDETEFDGELPVLVAIDQRASYLASAGMVNLGYGDLHHLIGDAADDAAHSDGEIPFGVWSVRLPAAQRLDLPDRLPLPHPRMRYDRDVDTWVTTETLISLTAPVDAGGAGLDLVDLGITECWITEHQGLVLKRWKEIIHGALKAAGDDPALRAMVADIYKGFIGRLQFDENTKALRHHYQPLWRASIVAHARHRNRVKAMKLADTYGIWPIKGQTDAWTYLAPVDAAIADDSPHLGKFRIEHKHGVAQQVQLTADDLARFYEAAHFERPSEPNPLRVKAVRTAISAAFSPDASGDDTEDI